MLLTMDATGIETAPPARTPAHVIVLGNEKGGSGKSTTAMHLIVALIKAGWRVASIDTDSRQRSLTRYIENRTRTARALGRSLELPSHYVVPLGDGDRVSDIEGREFHAFADVIDRIGQRVDFIVVDTPATNSYLMRLSHGMADTLVTPVNDSFVDVDVLGRIDQETMVVDGISHYAELVLDARRRRAAIDRTATRWVVVRNRLSALGSRNQQKVVAGLRALGGNLGFRVADGISERVVFRELFPSGLTVLDLLDRSVLGVEPTMSHVSARREIRELVACLDLPFAGGPARLQPQVGAGVALLHPAAAGQPVK